jgi:hypothetical protein
MHTHTHLETLEAREKTQVAISDTATHRPQHARFMCVCAQVSCSVVSNRSLCEFCGRVYCDILSIFLIPQFCLFFETPDDG